MKDIAPELIENIQKDFDEKFHSNKTIKALYEKVKDGIANYDDAQSFAKETGKILVEVFQSNLSSDVLPDGRMYYNIANRIIPKMLKLDHELISEISTGVINKINESAGIGIKARQPKLNEEKIKGIVDIVSGKAEFDKIAYMLKNPVINFSQCIVDDTVRENADFQYKSGLNPKIIRTTTGKCCKWCNSIAGVYAYEDAKKNPDVFKRHKNCDCKVEYVPGDGRRQNVHTKKWSRNIKNKEQINIQQSEDIKANNRKKDNIEYKQMMKMIGNDKMPISLEKFQEIKYNDINKYEQLKDRVIWSKAKFPSEKSLNGHFESHGNEFSNLTREEYQEKAANLLAEPVSEKVLGYDNQTRRVRYDCDSNTFVVGKLNQNNEAKVTTMFKPREKEEYYYEDNKRENNNN